MQALAITLLALACVVGLAWTRRHLMISREQRRGFLLSDSSPGVVEDAPFISVVVAAKDEQDNIENCVRSMLAQDYRDFEMIVCNDRSTDATGDIVARIARQDSRLRLINITHKPDDWGGKNNAMQAGIAASKGQWICMIDADCRQTSRRTLSVAMQYAREKDADLLSLLPLHELHSFWENVVQPVASGVLMVWFHPDKVNDPRRPNAYANGAFMLMKRSTYQAIGTHEAVKTAVNEDIKMAQRVKAAGLNLRVARSQGLYLVRMYSTFRDILRGWSRIFFGTFGTMGRLVASLLVMLFMGLSPYVAAASGLTAWSAGAAASGLWLACGIAGLSAVAMQLSVIYRFFGLAGARQGLFWTFPLGCVITVWALCVAISKLRRGAKLTWRNTTYTTG